VSGLMDELALREDMLLATVRRVLENTRRDQRELKRQHVDAVESSVHAQLRILGVPADYDKIYRSYVSHMNEPVYGPEALKRALFLQWYADVEYIMFTGIGNIDINIQAEVLREIQGRIEKDSIDTELIWMLRWYASIREWYFDPFTDLASLKTFLLDRYPDIQLDTVFTEVSLAGRGLMGEYWRSMWDRQKEKRVSGLP